PSSTARSSEAIDSSSLEPLQLPMPHIPYPTSLTLHPVLPNLRWCMGLLRPGCVRAGIYLKRPLSARRTTVPGMRGLVSMDPMLLVFEACNLLTPQGAESGTRSSHAVQFVRGTDRDGDSSPCRSRRCAMRRSWRLRPHGSFARTS